MINLNYVKTFLEAVQSFLTSLALVAGGIWTYYNYIYKRERWPQAELKISEASYERDGQIYLSVQINMRNIGQIMLPITSVVTRVQEVSLLNNNHTPRYYPKDEGVVLDWPISIENEKKYNKGELELEPNEVHQFDFDFLLKTDIRIVKITVYIPNIRKFKQGIGWLTTSIHSIQAEKSSTC
jgi:hypothetical protein